MISRSDQPGDLVFLTWLPDAPEEPRPTAVHDAYEAITAELASCGGVPIQERVFCSLEASEAVVSAHAEFFGAGAPTIVEGLPALGGSFAGIHVIAARPNEPDAVETISWNDRFCGRLVPGTHATYLGLSDVGRLLDPMPETPEAQAYQTLELSVRVLEACDWAFTDVCRTWFFLDDILSWYDDFNDARNRIFTDLGLLNGSRSQLIPASTGIRGRNSQGHRCTLDMLAVKPAQGARLSVETLHNPLQNEAPEYGSAFSRGLSVSLGSSRALLVSGTASIDEAGRTVHPGSFDRQTRRTLDNIESLLASRGAVMDDICQATAFIKRQDDLEHLQSILRSRGLDELPMVITIDDICRDDLLVEIDATALVPLRPPADV